MIIIREATKRVIKEYNAREEQIMKYIYGKGNMPSCDSVTCLNALQESIVKVIYITKGMFIQDIKYLFSINAEESVIDRAISSLSAKGNYLKRITTPYGILLVLSSKGLNVIANAGKYDSSMNIAESKIGETTYLRMKIKSARFAEVVFNEVLEMIFKAFFSQDLSLRNSYSVLQYCKNIAYRKFLELDVEGRKELLSQLEIDQETSERFQAATKNYKCDSELFGKLYYDARGYESIRKSNDYLKFVRVLKEDALRTRNLNTLFFLNDYLSSSGMDLKYAVLENAYMSANGISRYGYMISERNIEKEIDDKSKFAIEKNIVLLDKYINAARNKRKNLLISNTVKNVEDVEELQKRIATIKELQADVEDLLEIRKNNADDFFFCLLEQENGEDSSFNDVMLYIKKMEQMNIYINKVEKQNGNFSLCFDLVQVGDIFSVQELAKKLTAIYTYCLRMFPYARVSVNLLVYGEDVEELTRSQLVKALDLMNQFRSSRAAASLARDSVRIIDEHRKMYKKSDFYLRTIEKMETVILSTS